MNNNENNKEKDSENTENKINNVRIFDVKNKNEITSLSYIALLKEKENLIKILNEKINNFELENNRLKEDKKKYEEYTQNQIIEKNEIIKKQGKELDSLKSEKNTFKKKIEEYENKISELEIKLSQKEKDIQALNEDIKKTHLKFDQAIHQFDEMRNTIEEQKQKINELSKIKEENNNLKIENNKVKEEIRTGQTKEEYLITSAEKYYDVIVDISSFKSLKKEGWEIKYNKEKKETYKRILSEETIKIGVLGINNVGKSFLLSKIVKIDIPTGYSIETKGISIKYSKDKGEVNGICILDSAGFETPLLIEDHTKDLGSIGETEEKEDKKDSIENALKYNEIEDNLARDKAQTEYFIEQLIISLSDIIILVVGKLTRTEQKLITQIKNLVNRNDKNKISSIIIIHNLAQYHSKEEVENHISQYLKRSATFKLLERKVIGIEKYSDRSYFVEKTEENEDLEIFHYIMAKEGTEAGNYYNELTLELIKNKYNNFNRRRKIDIPKEIISLFSELSPDILGEKKDCEKSELNGHIAIKLSNDPKTIERKPTLNNIPNTCSFKIQNAYIDQDGNYLQGRNKFEPKYSLYFYKEKKKKNEDNDDEDNNDDENYDNYLLLRLEIPGNVTRLTARTTNPEKEKYKGIIIKGTKEVDKFEEENKKDFTLISDNRNYKEFQYFIELKRNLELSGTGAKGNTNIYKIMFDKRNKEKYFKDESKVEGKKEEDKNIKKEEVASGVYVLKFNLTDRSYVQGI